MPSELPRMPGETYQSMLRHGSAKGLGLQAGEVAWSGSRKGPTFSKDAKLVVAGSVLGIAAAVAGFVFLMNG